MQTSSYETSACFTEGGKKKQQASQVPSKPHFHPNSCCCDEERCKAYGPAVIVKPTSLNRLLYTNPVCLLTSVAWGLGVGSDMCAPQPHDEPLNIPRENVMTITWLTPTDTNGGLFLSMNVGRYTVQNILRTKRFVLNVPIAGMEDTVRAIGKCSGRDEILSGTSAEATGQPTGCTSSGDDKLVPTKLERLGVASSSVGFRRNPLLLTPTPTPDNGKDGSCKFCAESAGQRDEAVDAMAVKQHVSEMMKRSFLGDKNPNSEEYRLTAAALETSLRSGDVIINDCVAHIVCEIKGIVTPPPHEGIASCCSPSLSGPLLRDAVDYKKPTGTSQQAESYACGVVGTPQHLSIFAQMQVGALRKRYWTRGLFQPDSAELPPYLTFLGQGAFLHSTLPVQSQGE